VAYPIIITRMIAAANIPPGTFRLLRNPPADAMKLWMPELVFSNGGKGAFSPVRPRRQAIGCRASTPAVRGAAIEPPESLRVFGCLPNAGARGCTEAGVRKASREETAGRRGQNGVARWSYGDLRAAGNRLQRRDRDREMGSIAG